MANLAVGCLLAFLAVACGVGVQAQEAKDLLKLLPPSFDTGYVGMQYLLTSWGEEASTRELAKVLQESIVLNVSANCSAGIEDWLTGLILKQKWALHMVDAFGKVPSGLALGHLLLFGDFDQCLATRRFNPATNQSEQFANYCLTRLKHPAIAGKLPVLPAYGVCLPKACANPGDANAFLTDLVHFVQTKATQDFEAVQSVCVAPMQKGFGFYIMFSLIIVILTVIVAAGVIDCIFRRRYKESPNGFLNGNDVNDNPVNIYEKTKTVSNGLTTSTTTHHIESQRKPKYGYANVPAFLKPLLCWNIMTNLRSILSSGTEGEISFLHGFRVLSVWWIILGNTYFLGRKFIENSVTFYGSVKTAGFQIILNSGYAVDSFFLVSGLLITYVILRDLSKHDGKLNWILVYVHRWWRLSPVYVFVMLFYVYVLPHGISSPFKLIIQQQPGLPPTDYCKSHWWTNILYINNFFPILKTEQCMNWTWLLALDFQFFLIAPVLVYILYKNRVVGLAIIGALIAASVATTMILIGYYGLPLHWYQERVYSPQDYNVTVQSTETVNDSFGNSTVLAFNQTVFTAGTGFDENVDYIHEKPYTRIIPFLVGVLLGYIFVNRPADKQERPSTGGRLVAAIGWTISLNLAIPLLFGFHFSEWYEERPPQLMAVSSRVLYGGLQRLGWSLVVGWVLFACQYGYAGPIRSFLGSRFWRPLSNLTYGAYLVHMLTMQLYFASQRHMIYYSTLNFATIFLAQLFLTYAVALLIAVLVEIPLLRLERLVIRRSL